MTAEFFGSPLKETAEWATVHGYIRYAEFDGRSIGLHDKEEAAKRFAFVRTAQRYAVIMHQVRCRWLLKSYIVTDDLAEAEAAYLQAEQDLLSAPPLTAT